MLETLRLRNRRIRRRRKRGKERRIGRKRKRRKVRVRKGEAEEGIMKREWERVFCICLCVCLCSIHLSYVAYLLPSHRSLIPTIRLPTYLVKSRTQEDERVQRPSSVPVVHTFVPVFLIPKISQDFTDAFYRYVIHEWCSVTYFNGEIMWRSEVIWCEIV